uniref:Uncharacterized protein n=1 Tax=Nonomuraea gerenzanensis TaxID=93944 RepID=A0A1M4E7S8_9ACTN|nr:hypothetical protein [Nonomuraea gerenzanensis]SBO94900.1 hypothetical protein BN4615_P4416 [Nonomuraea gerenzanensis]
MLRRVYDVHDDPAELLDAARFPDAGAIERHLIDRLIDRQPVLGSDELRFSRDDTRRWLAFLSDHMTGPKTGDLAWWQLPRALSPVLHHGAGGYFGGALMLLVGLTIEVLALPLGWVWLLSIVAAGGLGGALATMAGRRRCLALYPRHYGRGTPASPRTTLRTALASAAAQVVGGGVAAALLIYLVPFAVTGSTPGPQEVLVGAYVAGLMGGLSTPGFTYLLTVVFLAYRRRIPPRLMTFLEHSARIGLLREVGPVYQFRYPHLRDVLVSRHPAGVTAPEASPAAVPGPPPVPVIPPASKIDAVARRKVCEAALVQPDVLRIIDDAREDRSHEAVTALLQRLLAEHADQVERAASAQYERFAQARRRLVEAARLPFWSRPAVPYLWGAWLAGATAAWTAGMWWSPVAFRASLGVALGGCAAVLLVRRRVRGARIEGLFRAVVTPLAPLLVLGIVLSLFSQVPRPPAEPPLVLWLSLALWLVATLLWLSSVPAMRDRAILASRDPAEWLQLPASLVGFRVAAEQAYQDWIGALVREGLMPCFHAVVDDEQDAMTTVLPQFEQNRLGGLSRVEEFVPTEESRYLEHLIARLNSASVGVSGSRGVGKSTVLRHLCARDREDGTANLRLLVHAPTAYDAKEFITHLFAEVCEEVAGEAAAHAHPGRQRSLLGLLPAITTVAGTVLLVGGLRWDQLRPMMAGLTARPALLVAALGGLLAAAGLAATWRANRRRRRVTGATASEVAARDHLRSLRYQQAVTATRTGELGVPGGGKLGGQWAVQRTEQARGYPQLVAELRELLGQIALDRQDRKGKVIIGIDELDKIGNAEDAERLLNDLKVVFGVPGCFFLVALSEDALSAFERRSLAFRNTFDSAFDRIVRITPLRHAESRQLLMRRGIALPLPYVWLCHALTGGLPRDLLRTALDLTTIASQEGEHDLSPLAARMIRQDLAVIIGAHLRDAAQLPGKHAPAVTEWLARCAAISSLSVTALDDLAGGVPPDAADEPVAVQACAYLHILAALIVIFIERPADCLAALQAEAQPGTVDRIAEARLLLATDPRLAWHRIRRIRAAAPFH